MMVMETATKPLLEIPAQTEIKVDTGHRVTFYVRVLLIKYVVDLAAQGEGAVCGIFIKSV
jgi:hypothetical protein